MALLLPDRWVRELMASKISAKSQDPSGCQVARPTLGSQGSVYFLSYFAVKRQGVLKRLPRSGLLLLGRRGLRKNQTRCAMWLLQPVGLHRGALHPRCSMRSVRRGAQHQQTQVPSRRVLCGQGPGVHSRRGQAPQLPGPHTARLDPFPKKKEARQAAKGWMEATAFPTTPQGGPINTCPTTDSPSGTPAGGTALRTARSGPAA